MTEAQIGSLPWVAGIWWLTIAVLCHWASYACTKIGAGTFCLAWLLIRASKRSVELATSCAIEAGAVLDKE